MLNNKETTHLSLYIMLYDIHFGFATLVLLIGEEIKSCAELMILAKPAR